MSPSHHIPLCFRPSSAADTHQPPPSSPAPVTSGNSNNITTCLYQTHLGVFSLTCSRTFFGHSLNLFLHSQNYHCHSSPLSLSSSSSAAAAADLSLSSLISFDLHINPFFFWRKRGSRRVSHKTQVFWDFTRAKFGSGPEPRSGFYIAVVVDGDMSLLVGDCVKEAYARTRAVRPTIPQSLFLRREHVFGNRVFVTKSSFGGTNREISIDCRVDEDAKLCFSFDDKRVLQIKRLKWKFRGNEKIEIDGVNVQISWDVYNWLFENKNSNNIGGGHAVFMFRFDGDQEEFDMKPSQKKKTTDERNGVVEVEEFETTSSASQKKRNGVVSGPCSFGGIAEWRRMRRSLLRSARSSSSSSISMSSASSACSSSVLEWASSADEAEYGGGGAGGAGGAGRGLGFSLLVYAWRK